MVICFLLSDQKTKRMRTRNPEKRSLQRSRYRRRAITELRDCYIKNLLCKGTQLKRRDITQELIQIKREELKSYRQLKPLKPHRQPEELDLYRQLKALLPCGFRVCIGCLLTLPIDSFYMQGGIHKGSGRVSSRCKRCYNKQCIERRQNSPIAREIQNSSKRIWVSRNKEKHRLSVKICYDKLTDGVVASFLGMKLKDVPKPMIDARRALIKLNREIIKYEKHK